MPTVCHCPSCQSKLQVPDDLLGRTVRCPKCSATFVAMTEAVAAQPMPLPAQPVAPPPEHLQATPPVRSRREEPAWDDFHAGEDFAGRRPPADYPPTLPKRGRAVVAMALLGANALVSLMEIGINALQFARYSGMVAADLPGEEDFSVFDLVEGCSGFIYFAVTVATVITFCMWIHRAHKNLSLLGAEGLQYSAGWAVGYFFIPIVNLFRPYQVTQEIWKASDPAVPPEDPFAWKNAPGSGLIGAWWALWIITNIVGNVVFRMTLSPNPTPDMLKAGAVISAVDEMLSIAAALLAILVIKRIQERQDPKYEQVLEAVGGRPYA
jgi:predicted Zn finger-like uncharacterized protein